MDAKEARELAESNRDPNAWDYPDLDKDEDHGHEKYPLERITEEAWDMITSHIELRAGAGCGTLAIEPFVNIPGKVHPKPVEDEVCGTLVQRLSAQGFSPCFTEWWYRADGRVVFRIKW